jgi:transcriptional regulator with XRE-family HTH domain
MRFGLYELGGMKIAAFRKDVLQLSQEEFAQRLGLKSKAHISEIERKNRCAPGVALQIERLSEGVISAAEISPAVALIRASAA